MKSKLKIIMVAAMMMAFAFASTAQYPHRGPKAAKKVLQPVQFFAGTVASWETNDDFVYNGFYLQSVNEKLLVRFPTYKGDLIMASLKSANTIVVSGVVRITPLGDKEIRVVSIAVDGKNIFEATPNASATEPAEELVNGDGKISAIQKNKQGKVKGYELFNKTVLHIPADIAQQLGDVAIEGAEVTYRGVVKVLRNGEVSKPGFKNVICQTITINGKQYLTI